MKVPKVKGAATYKNNKMYQFDDDFVLPVFTPLKVETFDDDSISASYWDGSKWVPVDLVPVDDKEGGK